LQDLFNDRSDQLDRFFFYDNPIATFQEEQPEVEKHSENLAELCERFLTERLFWGRVPTSGR
jgi:hypothetical protein